MNKKTTKKKSAPRDEECFSVTDLHVSVGDTPIIRGVTFALRPGQIHILMGPNGSGKSTLLNAIFGNPHCTITSGTLTIGKKDFTTAPVHERARAGLFLGFQEPAEIPGVTIGSFLRTAKNTINEGVPGTEHLTPMAFAGILKRSLQTLDLDERFGGRSLNDGFSGGEKKKNELLQMVVLQPRFALLDEFDSGLDVDALKVAVSVIMKTAAKEKTGFLLVSHNPRILKGLTPSGVHVMAGGRIVRTGGSDVLKEIDKHGYERLVGGIL
ncbi:Fe-S cluster assembly ATPase SufC [Candidatus Uhrbacteria bacterium]|nr:Fe-S cluster assembly ATPase SufC [Candidatus Uhrbacteria bacterium]